MTSSTLRTSSDASHGGSSESPVSHFVILASSRLFLYAAGALNPPGVLNYGQFGVAAIFGPLISDSTAMHESYARLHVSGKRYLTSFRNDSTPRTYLAELLSILSHNSKHVSSTPCNWLTLQSRMCCFRGSSRVH